MHFVAFVQKNKRYRNFFYNSFYNRRNRYKPIRPKTVITPRRRVAKNNFLTLAYRLKINHLITKLETNRTFKKRYERKFYDFLTLTYKRKISRFTPNLKASWIFKTKYAQKIKNTKRQLKKPNSDFFFKNRLYNKIKKVTAQRRRYCRVKWNADAFRRFYPYQVKAKKRLKRVGNFVFPTFLQVVVEEERAFLLPILAEEKIAIRNGEDELYEDILWEELLERAAVGEVVSFRYGDESYYAPLPKKKVKKETTVKTTAAPTYVPRKPDYIDAIVAAKPKVVDHGRYSGDVDSRYDNYEELHGEEDAADEREECEYLEENSEAHPLFKKIYARSFCFEESPTENKVFKKLAFFYWIWEEVYPNEWYGLEGLERDQKGDAYSIFKYWELTEEQLADYGNTLENVADAIELNPDALGDGSDEPVALDRHPDWIDCENEETGLLHIFDIFTNRNPFPVLVYGCVQINGQKDDNLLNFLKPASKHFVMEKFPPAPLKKPKKKRKSKKNKKSKVKKEPKRSKKKVSEV